MNTVRNIRADSMDSLDEAFADAPLREARVRSELHSFFQEKIDSTVIDGLLSRVSGADQEGGVSDVERLHRFLALRAIADSKHVEKVRLVLTSERHESKWRYEFRVGDAILYTSGSLNVGYGRELAEYEDEYILQLFPLSIDLETIRRELMVVGDRGDDQAFGDVQRLERFKNLANTALPEHIDRFKREVLIDSNTKQWAYKLSIGGICVCHRHTLDIENSNDVGVFQHAELLQRFRKVLRGNGSEPDILLRDAVFKFEKSDLGLAVSLAKNFCAMAAIAKTAHWEEASIELADSFFRLKYDGKTLFQAALPSSINQNGLGIRAHLTILALELALLSIEATFRVITQNLDRQPLLSPGVAVDQAKRFTLGQAIHTMTDKQGEIRVKRMMGLEKGAASYELRVMSSHQAEKVFFKVDTAPLHRTVSATVFLTKPLLRVQSLFLVDSGYESGRRILQGLCAVVREQIYNASISKMNESETIVLHAWMQEKKFCGEFTLGGILNTPILNSEQLARAVALRGEHGV